MRNDNHIAQLLVLEEQFNSIQSLTFSLKSCRRSAREWLENLQTVRGGSDRRYKKIKLQTPKKMTISAEPLQNLLVMRLCRTRRAQCVSLQDLRREEAETLLIFANKQTSEAFFFFFFATTLNGNVLRFRGCICRGFGEGGIKDRAHFGISVTKSNTLSAVKHNLIIL